jgi:hypothetical protein
MTGHDDYLWDKSGPPDPEIERLERALRPFRCEPGAQPRRRRSAGWSALLAAAALIGVTLWLAFARGVISPSPYRIETLAGHVRVTDAAGRPSAAHPRPGDRIVSGDGARARLEIGPIGSVLVEADTRLRIENGDAPHDADYMLYLEHGTVEASIFAAPRIFQVGTPSGIAVDLGCRYTATVEEEGETLLRVISGAVAFETEKRKVYVPEDAECIATPDGGPGTPVWQDHAAGFKDAVAALDRSGPPAAATLETVFASTEPRDALTWFHLLGHADASVRDRALERIAATVRLPQSVDLAAVAAQDEDELDALLDELKWRWW